MQLIKNVFFFSVCYISWSVGIESENYIPRQLSPEVLQALRGVRFIAQHIKDADKDNEVCTFQIKKNQQNYINVYL